MSCPNCGPSGAPARATVRERGARRTIALVGNPNVGKSTMFNHVTGARQKIVNAPGTTVTVMAGTWRSLGLRVLDLPGTYSLIPTSPDEEAVTDTVAGAPGSLTDPAAGLGIDLVLAVLDGGSLTRSLYLLAQLAQTGLPVAGAITMGDVAEQDGEPIDVSALARATGIPIVAIDPRGGSGYQALDAMVSAALDSQPHISGLAPDPHAPGYSARYVCDCDPTAATCTCDHEAHGPVTVAAYESGSQESPRERQSEMERATALFEWVESVESKAHGRREDPAKLSRSDKIDRFLLHPLAGTLTFFVLLWLLFQMAGSWLGPIQDWFDGIFSSTDTGAISLANAMAWAIGVVGLDGTWVESIVINGLCVGMGVVASFFPLMFVIYAALTILEDSGYMARVAFLGDRLMRRIGLDGRVILPLIMGFGCNLPSLAAARTLPSAKQRLVTVLITPYTSCAARLTIYLMIGKVFFGGHAGTVVFAMYLISLVLIVGGAWVLKHFVTKDEQSAPLMLVLPAYQVPRLLVLARTTWQRAWTFVTGAGKIIVLMTLVVWFMGAVPMSDSDKGFADPELSMEDSLYGAAAQVLEPVFAPAGFGEWHMTGALMTGFVAKETVVSSIVTSYNLDPDVDAGNAEDNGDDMGQLPELLHQSLGESAGTGYEGLAAFAFLVFVLAYTPCMATVAEQAKLIGGKKTAVAVIAQLAIAWVLATAIFQIGSLFIS